MAWTSMSLGNPSEHELQINGSSDNMGHHNRFRHHKLSLGKLLGIRDGGGEEGKAAGLGSQDD
jgi:hypothetical protein